jgi:hypothetical protein
MRRTLQHNKKLVSWLLACAMILLAFPAGATWQCVTGATCPPDCMMLHPASAERLSCTPASVSHCSCCQNASAVVIASARHTSIGVACTASQCVLRVQVKPETALRSGLRLPFPLLALPPLVPIWDTATVTVPGDLYTPPLAFFSERFYRPHLGRAPPVLL